MVVARSAAGERPQFFVTQKRNEISELKALFRNLPVENASRPENTEKRREMLKRLTAYMSMGIDVSSLFPEVVLASATADIVQKRLVSIYLNNYAESNPETAVLVINAYQKDLLHADPRIRGLALKALSSLGVDSVEEYARAAVTQGLSDTSSYVKTLAVIGVNKLIYDSGLGSDLLNALEGFVDSAAAPTKYAVDLQVLITTILVLMDIRGGAVTIPKRVIVHLFNRLAKASRFQKTVILHILKTYVPDTDDELVGLLQTTEPHLSSATPSVVTSSVICMLSLIRNRYWANGDRAWATSPLALSVVQRVAPSLITLSAHYSILRMIYDMCTMESAYCNILGEYWVWLVPKFEDQDCIKTLKLQILCLFNDSIVLDSIPSVMVIHAESEQVLDQLVNLYKTMLFKRCEHLEIASTEPSSGVAEGDDACELILHQLIEWYSTEIPNVCSALLPLLSDLFLTHPDLRPYCESLLANVYDYMDDLSTPALEALLAICVIQPLALDVKYICERVFERVKTNSDDVRLLVPLLHVLLKVLLKFPSAVKDVLFETLQFINARLTDLPVDVAERYLITVRLLGRERETLVKVYGDSFLNPRQMISRSALYPSVKKSDFNALDSSPNAQAVLSFGPTYERNVDEPAEGENGSTPPPPPPTEESRGLLIDETFSGSSPDASSNSAGAAAAAEELLLFQNLVTRPNATREELTLLCNDYPTSPLTWCALYKYLPREEGRAMLLEKAKALRSVELWRELLLQDEPNLVVKYQHAKTAVEEVGHDPRSGVVWATFLGLYAALHNAFLALVTKEQDEHMNAQGNAQTAENNAFPSAVAPLVQLVPAERSYSERHASTVGSLSMSTFFTSASNSGSTPSKAASVIENAMLTSPIAFLAPDMGLQVSNNPPSPEELRRLVAEGDLNLVSYCEHLRKLCLTPVQDVPNKSVRQVLATLMPEMIVDPAATMIQKQGNIDFEATYPSALFQRPTSAIVPALEAVSVPGWTRILRLEMSNWLQIEETDKAQFEARLAYFFAVALRQCANVPDVRFLYAQRQFSQGEPQDGLRTLLNVPLAAQQLELTFIIADVYDLLMQDIASAISVLCRALAKSLHAGDIDDTSRNVQSRRTRKELLGCLAYQIVLRRLRQGGESLPKLINAVLTDTAMRPAITEDLCLSLLILAANHSSSPDGGETADLQVLLEKMLQILPDAAVLYSLKFTNVIAATPDYMGAYISKKHKLALKGESQTPESAAASSRLLSLAMTQAYFLSSQTNDIVMLAQDLPARNMLCTPQGLVDYEDYVRFVTALPSQSLTTVSSTLLPNNPMTIPEVPVTSSAVKGVIELGRKLDTLIDIARQMRDSSLHAAKPGDFKAASVLQVFQKAVTASKHALTERQVNELHQLTKDPACLQSLRVWLNDA